MKSCSGDTAAFLLDEKPYSGQYRECVAQAKSSKVELEAWMKQNLFDK